LKATRGVRFALYDAGWRTYARVRIFPFVSPFRRMPQSTDDPPHTVVASQDAPHPAHLRLKLRGVLILALCLLAAVLLSIDSLNAGLHRVLAVAEPVIATHPVSGLLLFVVLSALSAVIAFFSSALLVPVAVYTWGTPLTAALLWLGWWIGGACTYAFGRALRRPLVRMSGSDEHFEFYRRRIPADVGFPAVLLLQIALPSEIPGYLCGVIGVPFRTYALALAVAELPYAVGTVLIGDSLLQQRTGLLLSLGVLGAVASGYAVRRLRRRLSPPSSV
jgi:uncharacterized membrane protein YdjX (TVP38/TMEM64 family)